MGCIYSVVYKKIYGWITPKSHEDTQDKQKESSLSSSDQLAISVGPDPLLSSSQDLSSSLSSSQDLSSYLVISGSTFTIEKVAEEIIRKATQNNLVAEWTLLEGEEGIPQDQALDYISFKLEHHMNITQFSNEHYQSIVASIGKDNTWIIHKNDGKHFLLSIRAYHSATFTFDFSIGICNIVS